MASRLIWEKNNINKETTRAYLMSLYRRDLDQILGACRRFCIPDKYHSFYYANKKDRVTLLLDNSPGYCFLCHESHLIRRIINYVRKYKENFRNIVFKVKINFMKDEARSIFVLKCALMSNSALDFKKCILESKFSHITRQDYEKMKVLELKAMCKDKGLKRYSNKRKPELIDMLE